MYRNEKADLRRIGQKTNFLNGHSKKFSAPKYILVGTNIQCLQCGSDYMRFHVEGLCQRCQQRVEFIQREQHDARMEGCQ